MVLYAVIAEESVSRLFSAGFMPGVIMGLMLIAISLYQAYKNNYPKGAPFALKNVGKTFLKAIPGILMPAIILGGIFSGYFTPSEAAAVALSSTRCWFPRSSIWRYELQKALYHHARLGQKPAPSS